MKDIRWLIELHKWTARDEEGVKMLVCRRCGKQTTMLIREMIPLA
jgi:hypothetical protein